MFAAAIIVFREVLEAAILLGILAAATRTVPGRARWLVAGCIAGLAAAGLVAAVTQRIAGAVSGVGQEIFNAVVLGTAVVMLAWHNLWMATHGASLAADAHSVGHRIRDGRSERSVLFLVAGLAVLREGAETVLFLSGVAFSSEAGAMGMLGGSLMGLLAGVLAGYALYAGLLRIPLRHLFSATSILVLLIAAGMSSQSARFLIQADLIPSLAAPLWDTSSMISPSSITGVLLHGFIGYDARPAGMQIVVYLVVLTSIGLGMMHLSRSHREARSARTKT